MGGGNTARQMALRALLGLTVVVTAELTITTMLCAAPPLSASRHLYAVNEAASDRGSISVYDIEQGIGLLNKSPRFLALPMSEEWRSAQ